jgi:hypothetical protein
MRRIVGITAVAAMTCFAAVGWCQQADQTAGKKQPGQVSSSEPAPQQDSLAAAARKAREQRKEAPKAVKVFTNDNIPTAGDISSVGTAPVATPAAGSAPPAAPATASNDEKSWRDRFANLRSKLDQDRQKLDVMQRELGVLNIQYYSDPTKAMQQQYSRSDINKKSAQIDAQKEQVEADQKAIDDAQDDLRKAGGDPGWAR